MEHFVDSTSGADFIYENALLFHDIDFQFFKATLFEMKCPVLVRIHFSTSDYSMPDEMAKIIDNSGHAVLIVGWNELGFVVHDPWNKEWGGSKGGELTVLTYEEMGGGSNPSVNGTLDFMGCFAPIEVQFIQPTTVPLPGRDVEVGVSIRVPGLPNIHGKQYDISDLTAILKTDKKERLIATHGQNVRHGEKVTLKWRVNTRAVSESREFMVIVQGLLDMPKRRWERNTQLDERPLSRKLSQAEAKEAADWATEQLAALATKGKRKPE